MKRSAPKTRAMTDNAAWRTARPAVSVLVPFFRDDPSGLIEALSDEAQALAGSVELILLDDGSGDDALAERVTGLVQVSRLPTRFIEYAMMLFIAVTIVLCIRLVGIVLLMSLITVPQMTANLFTVNYSRIIFLSVLISFIGCIAGLMLSYYLNVPSGAFIIFVLIVVFFVGKIIKAAIKKKE